MNAYDDLMINIQIENWDVKIIIFISFGHASERQ